MFTIRKATVADCGLIISNGKEGISRHLPGYFISRTTGLYDGLDVCSFRMYPKQMEEEGHVYSIAYKEE